MQNLIMGMQKIFRLVGRVSVWVALIIIALNVENLAAALGFDKVLANSSFLAGLANQIWPVLTSDIAFYVALVMLGVGISAWVDYFARKWDGSHPTKAQQSQAQATPLYYLACELENLSRSAWLDGVPAHIYSKVCGRYEILRSLGFTTPRHDLCEFRTWGDLHAKFCSLLWPLLENGQIKTAKYKSAIWSRDLNQSLPSEAEKAD